MSKSLDSQIVKAKKHLKNLKKIKIYKIKRRKELEPKYIVLAGAQAHYHTWGNHNMTTSTADEPTGSELLFYEHDYEQKDNWVKGHNTFRVVRSSMNQQCKATFNDHFVGGCIILNHQEVLQLYKWLSSKPWGNLLVASAKNNTIKLTKAQYKNITSW